MCSSTYTDEDIAKARWSDHVCIPCSWAMTGKPPDTLRLWSIVYREDRALAQTNPKPARMPPACLTSKADTRPIVETLLHPPADGSPWFVAVAESGQIHVAPFAPVNRRADAWGMRFERREIRSTPVEFATVLWHVAGLLCAGFARGDVQSLEPHPSKLARHGAETWRQHADPLRRYIDGGLLALAIFLCTKDFTDGYRRDATRVAGLDDGGLLAPGRRGNGAAA